MRGKRSSPPPVEYQWGASILPGGPATNTPAAPPPPSMPTTPDAPPASAAAPAPHQFSAPPQPFAPPAPAAVPSRFGNTPEFGGAAATPATQRLGRTADFAAPVAPTQPQYGTPSQFGTAPQFGAPSQFGTAPQFGAPSQFGSPPQLAAPQGFYPGAYPGAAPGYGPPPGRRVPVAVWILLGLLVLGFVVAIPVFMSQHQKPANRNVSLPTTLLGQTQLDNPDLVATATQLAATMNGPGVPWGPASVAYYGTDSLPVFAVGTAKLTVRPTAGQKSAFFTSVKKSGSPDLTGVGAGPFGGQMECGPVSGGSVAASQCISIDNAAVIIVVVFQTSQDQAALLTRQVIGAVEH